MQNYSKRIENGGKISQNGQKLWKMVDMLLSLITTKHWKIMENWNRKMAFYYPLHNKVKSLCDLGNSWMRSS